MVDPFICIKTHFFRWFFIRRFLIFHQIFHTAGAKITDHNTLIIHRYHLAFVTEITHIGLYDKIINIEKTLIHIGHIGLNVFPFFGQFLPQFIIFFIYFEKFIQQGGFIGAIRYFLLVLKIIKDIGGII